MASETEDIQTKMTMYTIIRDKWDEIHAETFDDLASTLVSKPSPWEEYEGEGNRYKIVTTIGNEGKYENAACTDEAVGATDRKCRKVSIQVTDSIIGMTQAVNLAKVDSEYFNSRMNALETKAANLETKVAAAQSTADKANSNASSALSKFGSYYTKSETDSKMSSIRSSLGNVTRCTSPSGYSFSICVTGAITSVSGDSY